MKLVTVPNTPFGFFYFDPETHEGVTLDDHASPAVIGMSKAWDPYRQRGSREIDVDEFGYRKLREAALQQDRDGAEAALREHLLKPFYLPEREACSECSLEIHGNQIFYLLFEPEKDSGDSLCYFFDSLRCARGFGLMEPGNYYFDTGWELEQRYLVLGTDPAENGSSGRAEGQ